MGGRGSRPCEQNTVVWRKGSQEILLSQLLRGHDTVILRESMEGETGTHLFSDSKGCLSDLEKKESSHSPFLFQSLPSASHCENLRRSYIVIESQKCTFAVLIPNTE